HFAAVHVPAGAGRSATCLPRRRAGPAIDGDEADSRLDEASRQEQVLPQGIPAVAVTEAGVFALHVESPAWARGGGPFVGAAVQFQPSLLACGRAPFQAIEQLAASEHALRGLGRVKHIGCSETR